MSAEEDAREIARLLSGALPGGYEVRLRVTEVPEAHVYTSAGPWCGKASKAEFEMYRRFGEVAFNLTVPVADGRWRRSREEACAGLLREFGSMRRARYRNTASGLTVCFPAAGTPEETALRLAVEGCSIEGENALSRPA